MKTRATNVGDLDRDLFTDALYARQNTTIVYLNLDWNDPEQEYAKYFLKHVLIRENPKLDPLK